ncbi:MAG TPA: transglycosylase SLT domain-containing protein [Vicinamibacterales bacterium]|nr:transglycosylase SLT domain-containing protein [Vicinamibacterales bacterium]
MKKFVVLLLGLVIGSIGYAIAQQPLETPDLVPPTPVALVATDHFPLPKDLSLYWFVPGAGRATTAAKPDSSITSLARGAKAIADGEYANGLALVSRSDLSATSLNNYARYYQATALQGLSRLAEADTVLTALVASAPEGALGEAAKQKLAEVLLARPDATRAEQLLRGITSGSKGASDDVWMLLGQVEEALNHRDHAIEAYRKVYYSFPLGGRVADAKTGLDRLQSPVGVAGGAPVAEELARAERLFTGRRWAEARVALEPLVNVVSDDDRELVSLHLAESDFHLGRHRPARDRLKQHLESPSRGPEARYYYLSAVRGLGDRTTFVSLGRELVKDHPASPWAAETLDDLASYYVVDDQDDKADEVFRELLDRFPRHRYAERAAWKVGWAAYRNRKFAETARVFESAAVAFPRADYRPAWIYWSGRARDRMGDAAGALARYRLAVIDYGNSYYGRLASRLISSRPGAEAAAPTPARAVTAPATSSAPPTEPLMRALMTAGLFDDALKEVQYAQRTWGDSPALQATSAWIRAQQAKELRADERFAALRGSITTMRRAYPQFLSAEGETLPTEVLRVIFPLDYWDLIEKYSTAKNLDPYLVSALMAQESTFTPEIRSSANARGLMQVMPGTGRLYARKLGIRPFTTASLSQPETNVRIGTQYFKDLVDRFGGIHYALASYNAGDARVAEWIKEAPDLAQDEFIDNIPFPETQNYVKRILGTTEDYRRLYGTSLTASRRPTAD